MATQELKDLIDSLPDIAKYKYPGAECYAFNSEKDNYVWVLLDTGELVIADARVNYNGVPFLKTFLKRELGDDVTCLGRGVIHK